MNTGSQARLTLFAAVVVIAAIALAGCPTQSATDAPDDANTSSDTDTTDDTSATLSADTVLSAENGLVSYFPFDDDLTDREGNASVATIGSPALAADRNDEAGKARSFDEDGLQIGNPLDGAEAFTITAWIRDDGSNTDRYRTIASKVDESDVVEFAWRIRLFGNETWQDGTLAAFFNNNSGNEFRNADSPIMPGSWMHVALSFEPASSTTTTQTGATQNVIRVDPQPDPQPVAGMARLYENGVEVKSSAVVLTLGAGEISIGTRLTQSGFTTEEFSGSIDDVALFDRALSEEEVAALASDE